MRSISRRDFLQDSTLFAAALAATGTARAGEKATAEASKSDQTLRVAVIGVHGRGKDHVKSLAGRPGCVITTICDADSAVIDPVMNLITKKQGKPPAFEQDIRKVVEDKSIDAVTIAMPNHWHALAAIWAMQNGKDVYVEKPVSHNIREGRRMVETARKYGRICQTGTQSRSSKGMREAMEFIHTGGIGKIRLSRGLCYKHRGSIGKVDGDQPVPKTVNYDLWCGPSPMKPLHRKNLHYDWHWVWETGNGDLGNQGIHEMDKARWGLNKSEFPRSVVGLGGRFGYVDDGETANTQVCVFDYGDCELIFEVRGWPSKSPYPGKESPKDGLKPQAFVGNVFYGSEGVLVCPSYTSGIAYSNDGEVLRRFSGGDDHYGNFFKAVRSRKVEDLNADILEGHLSSSLCHLGNISYRLGTEQTFAKKPELLEGDKDAIESLGRMEEHLKMNHIETANYRLGRKLALNVPHESFLGDSEADAMLTREYRKGFEVPATV
jgi:Oxidoreductase family, NAD-binding Rossmann fold/Oxidoreductase family, C-terminal alpha/beta domain